MKKTPPLSRPTVAPRKIPAWAWHLEAWMSAGRKGPRPTDAPRHTPLWFWRWRAWELRRARKPGHRIDPNHPHAPTSHPLPPNHVHVKPHRAAPLEAHVVYWCHISLAYAGKMTYTENWTLRQRFFARAVGKFVGAYADCSQFVATILHWLGVTIVTSTDYTGTLLMKGRPIAKPKPGCAAVWGPRTGAHTAFVTEKTEDGKDWYCVGFGHQGAPDRNTLSGMNRYFASVGQPGVRFLEFTV